jgi:hypothetical protein
MVRFLFFAVLPFQNQQHLGLSALLRLSRALIEWTPGKGCRDARCKGPGNALVGRPDQTCYDNCAINLGLYTPVA